MEIQDIANELKSKYPEFELYATELKNGAVFIWRPLSPYEYKIIYNNPSLKSWEKEHAFCDLCILHSIVNEHNYPQGYYNFSIGVGGYATVMSGVILSLSGFGEDEVAQNMYDQAATAMTDFENQIPCMIKMAFGSDYTFDEIEHWNMKKIMYYLVRAEWMLGFKGTFQNGRQPIPQPQIKQPPQNQQGKEKIPREVWQNMQWEDISEQEFLRIKPPEEHYDPEADPELLLGTGRK